MVYNETQQLRLQRSINVMDSKKYRNLPAEAREEIREILRSLLSARPEIIFSYLHGSFGDVGPFADIDLAVYVDIIPESHLGYELALETACMRAIGTCAVDVRILNDAPLSFKYNVVKSGVPFVVRDNAARVEFQEHVTGRYLDFSYFRKQYLRETLGAQV
jgi:hypothetical protein